MMKLATAARTLWSNVRTLCTTDIANDNVRLQTELKRVKAGLRSEEKLFAKMDEWALRAPVFDVTVREAIQDQLEPLVDTMREEIGNGLTTRLEDMTSEIDWEDVLDDYGIVHRIEWQDYVEDGIDDDDVERVANEAFERWAESLVSSKQLEDTITQAVEENMEDVNVEPDHDKLCMMVSEYLEERLVNLQPSAKDITESVDLVVMGNLDRIARSVALRMASALTSQVTGTTWAPASEQPQPVVDIVPDDELELLIDTEE